jgi:hypothetical protein
LKKIIYTCFGVKKRIFFARIQLLLIAIISTASASQSQQAESGTKFDYSARIMVPEYLALDGCVENFSNVQCSGKIPLILTGKISRTQHRVLPLEQSSLLPNPQLNYISNTFLFRDPEHCDATQIKKFQKWAAASESADSKIKVSLLPKELAACFGREIRGENQRYEYFWFFRGQNMIGSMECASLETVPNPLCTIYAYPLNGLYWAQLGFFPAVNAMKIIEQFPEITLRLLKNLPNDETGQPPALVGMRFETPFMLTPQAQKKITEFGEKLE